MRGMERKSQVGSMQALNNSGDQYELNDHKMKILRKDFVKSVDLLERLPP